VLCLKAVRNSAKIPVGRLYVSFPVFTEENLADQLGRKARAEKKADEFRQEKDEKLALMKETDNLFLKALHYRDAVQAHESMDWTGYRTYSLLPAKEDFVAIQGGLLLGTKGGVYMKSSALGKRIPLGDAFIRQENEKDIP
jgi:hypothetical protein